MRYRDAKSLQPGDQVRHKESKEALTIVTTEVYGLTKVVRLNCVTLDGNKVSYYHSDVE